MNFLPERRDFLTLWFLPFFPLEPRIDEEHHYGYHIHDNLSRCYYWPCRQGDRAAHYGMSTEIEILYWKQYNRSLVLHKKDLARGCHTDFQTQAQSHTGSGVNIKSIIRMLSHSYNADVLSLYMWKPVVYLQIIQTEWEEIKNV